MKHPRKETAVTPEYAVMIARRAMLLTLLVSSPMLGFGLIVGVVVSILQAVTQVNEMTLTFIPKIIAVLLAMAIFMPWIMQIMIDFTVQILTAMPTLVG